MNTEFQLDALKKRDIAQKFGVSSEACDKLYNFYKQATLNIRHQYLAHVIRTIELYMREKEHSFCIILKESLNNIGDYFIAKGEYHHAAFIIHYNPNLSPFKQRISIAHELGHLFLVATLGNENPKKVYGEGHSMEPLASIFGVFAIAEKNDFYANEAQNYVSTNTLSDLLEDFCELMKKQ
jgi:Zn-dependent peptidase ImmA (M78 family)